MKVRRLSQRELAELLDALRHLRNAVGLASFGIFVEEVRLVAALAVFAFLVFSLLVFLAVRVQDQRERELKAAEAARNQRIEQRRRVVARRIDRQRRLACTSRRD